jgi:cytochrome b561
MPFVIFERFTVCRKLFDFVTPAMTTHTPQRYGRTAIVLHWFLALAIVLTFAVGMRMADMPNSPTRLQWFSWHKWAGITILALSALRLLWRLTHKPPAELPMPAWQRLAAHLAHGLMYGLFFAVPLVGWAYSSAAGFPVVLFGVLPLPDWVAPSKQLAEAIEPWHGYLAYTLAALVLLHVVAALQHHFIQRDGLLRRMGWGNKP